MATNKSNGSISIYLALSLTLVLSLLLTIIESCRLNIIKTTAVGTSYMALDSTFGHFATQLLDSYGVFGTFKTEEDFTALLNSYIRKTNKSNIIDFSLNNTTVKNLYKLTDNDGLIFASQVVHYQKYHASFEYIENLIDSDTLDIFKSNNTTSYNFLDDNNSISNDQLSSISDINNSSDANQEHSDIPNNEAEEIKQNLSDKISFIMREALIKTCLDDPEKVSNATISQDSLNVFPSTLCNLSEEAKKAIENKDTSILTSLIDFSLYASYLKEHFSTFTTDLDNSVPIKYQLEYILFGGETDEQILSSSIINIVALRTSMNLAHILSDSSKRTLAYDIANAAVGALPIPFIVELTQLLIMSSWANAEAIIDMRDLFKEKKVPLLKDDSTWTLSLQGVLDLNKTTTSSNPGDTGFTYDEYLYIYLLTTSNFHLYYRTMDLIQLDLCHNVNPDFLMVSCYTAADVKFDFSASPLFTNIFGLLPYSFDTTLLYGYD